MPWFLLLPSGTPVPAAAAAAATSAMQQQQQQHKAFVQVLSHCLNNGHLGWAQDDLGCQFWDMAMGSLPALLQCMVLQGAVSDPTDRLQQLRQCMCTLSRLLDQLTPAARRRAAFLSRDASSVTLLVSGADDLHEAAVLDLAPAVQRCIAEVAAATSGAAAAAGSDRKATVDALLELSELLNDVDEVRLLAGAQLPHYLSVRLGTGQTTIHAKV
jgi:hypothetical protein